MGKSARRPQNSKRDRAAARAAAVANPDLMRGMQELRKGSRTSPHRDRSKYSRTDYRLNWED